MQTTDERCNELACDAMADAVLANEYRRLRGTFTLGSQRRFCATRFHTIARDTACTADRIIAERTRELAAQDGAK